MQLRVLSLMAWTWRMKTEPSLSGFFHCVLHVRRVWLGGQGRGVSQEDSPSWCVVSKRTEVLACQVRAAAVSICWDSRGFLESHLPSTTRCCAPDVIIRAKFLGVKPCPPQEPLETHRSLEYVMFWFFFFFWLRWGFIAACRLFSSCGEWGLLSRCSA